MPTLETARLILRPFVADDLTQYHSQIYSDPDVTRYLPGGVPRPVERTRAVLDFSVEHGEKHGFTLWAVIDKTSGQLIGQCGLLYMQNAVDVEIAYAFGKAYWGQGYAAEAGRACLRYGFETAGLAQIVAVAYTDNLASQRVMQKIGMLHQGITDQYYNDELVLYTMQREDFQPDELPYKVSES
jgi:[ribosomal protein S5]-alanine N-acetyltransferase